MALPIKFVSICLSLAGSAITITGTLSSILYEKDRFFSQAFILYKSAMSFIISQRSKGFSSSLKLPASIFEKSRISFTIKRRDSAAIWATSTQRFCLLSISDFLSRESIPRTPFMGVLISWLIFARNSLFALFASSAVCLACLCSISAFLSKAASLIITRAFSGEPSISGRYDREKITGTAILSLLII